MTLQKIKLISNTKNRFNESTKRNRLKILNVPGFVRLPHEIIPLEHYKLSATHTPLKFPYKPGKEPHKQQEPYPIG